MNVLELFLYAKENEKNDIGFTILSCKGKNKMKSGVLSCESRSTFDVSRIKMLVV